MEPAVIDRRRVIVGQASVPPRNPDLKTRGCVPFEAEGAQTICHAAFAISQRINRLPMIRNLISQASNTSGLPLPSESFAARFSCCYPSVIDPSF